MLYVLKLQQCLLNNWMTAGPTETDSCPTIAVDVEKNVRSIILYFQVNNGGGPSLTGSQFFCSCVSTRANDIRGIGHDNCLLYERQFRGSFEILVSGNHFVVLGHVRWDEDRHFHCANPGGYCFRTAT